MDVDIAQGLWILGGHLDQVLGNRPGVLVVECRLLDDRHGLGPVG